VVTGTTDTSDMLLNKQITTVSGLLHVISSRPTGAHPSLLAFCHSDLYLVI